MYLANTSMEKKAFCNNDGDMLILPQQGRLDIQTEFGKYVLKCNFFWEVFDHYVYYYRLMVRSGELCVIQRGIKFKVNRLSAICRITTHSRGYRSSFPMVPPVVVCH
jgi:homogentisate 1,2-dioxygenase